jgi:hypothetical protein
MQLMVVMQVFGLDGVFRRYNDDIAGCGYIVGCEFQQSPVGRKINCFSVFREKPGLDIYQPCFRRVHVQMRGIGFKSPLLSAVLGSGMPEPLNGEHGLGGFRRMRPGGKAAVKPMADKNGRKGCGKQQDAEKKNIFYFSG